MPRVLGDSFIHVNRVQAIVEATEPLPTLEGKGRHRDREGHLRRHILPLIRPGLDDPDGDRRRARCRL